MKIALYLGIVLALASCRVGPDYRRPDCDMPVAWTVSDEAKTEESPDECWWESFDDEQLVRYIRLASHYNKDIQTALANISEARALRAQAASRLYPDIDAELRYNRNSFNTFFGGAGDVNPGNIQSFTTNFQQEIFFVGLDAIWEIDIFGRTRRQVEAACYRIGSSIEYYYGALISVFAETAWNYLDARGLQEKIFVKEREIEVMCEALQLTGDKYLAGLISDIELKNREAELSRLESELPHLYTELYAAIYRLSVLTGHFPGGLLEEMQESKPLPELPRVVNTGLPSELLQRRPDIRQAETELAAATADIGVAVGDLFPRFFLAASIGDQKFSLPTQTLDGFVWSYTADILTPIFHGGRIQASIREKKAKAEQAFYTYENTILQAVEETEDRLLGYTQELDRIRSLSQALKDNTESWELTRLLYDKGITDAITALEKERETLQSRESVIDSRIQAFEQLVGLYKALGGGWECEEGGLCVQ